MFYFSSDAIATESEISIISSGIKHNKKRNMYYYYYSLIYPFIDSPKNFI